MKVDLSRITRQGKALFLAYDQGMEHGPTDFSDENIDPAQVLKIADSGYFTAVILQKGVAEKYYFGHNYKVPLILKLNGKTNLLKDQDPYSPQVCSVKEALSYGAVAVGYTIYVGSEFESKMTQEFGQIEQEAEEAGMAVIAWMYPRGRSIADETDPKLVAYAARVGLELGADIIKVRYTGDLASFKWVVAAAGKTKVVAMGGSKEPLPAFLERTKNVIAAGGIGLAVGRNIWQAEKPLEVSQKIAEVIWGRNV
ncbi:MAG TPA: fructose-bisphosphate aldolase [Clostridia bacterium]|nr:fructose-bisphosphate aldolase [Clostridia bacterium]